MGVQVCWFNAVVASQMHVPRISDSNLERVRHGTEVCSAPDSLDYPSVPGAHQAPHLGGRIYFNRADQFYTGAHNDKYHCRKFHKNWGNSKNLKHHEAVYKKSSTSNIRKKSVNCYSIHMFCNYGFKRTYIYNRKTECRKLLNMEKEYVVFCFAAPSKILVSI